MTPKQLKAFTAVAQTLSFARACERLHMSQPALSLAIKSLEQSLGGRLLTRTTREVRLTPEGAELLPQALQLLADWENLRERLRQRFTLRRGRVTIAAMPSFSANILPRLLREYRDLHPSLQVTIQDVVQEEVLNLLESGRVELGFGFEPEARETFEFAPLLVDRFMAIVAADSPLADTGTVSWTQLLSQDFITLQRPSSMRRLLEESLAAKGLQLHVSLECHQLVTVGHMVAAGLGVSVVPSLCNRQMSALGIRCLRVHRPRIQQPVGLITRQDRELSVAAASIVAFVRKRACSEIRNSDPYV